MIESDTGFVLRQERGARMQPAETSVRWREHQRLTPQLDTHGTRPARGRWDLSRGRDAQEAVHAGALALLPVLRRGVRREGDDVRGAAPALALARADELRRLKAVHHGHCRGVGGDCGI